jgi:hypothetical protein
MIILMPGSSAHLGRLGSNSPTFEMDPCTSYYRRCAINLGDHDKSGSLNSELGGASKNS